MKVKELINKIKLIDTEIIIKENFETLITIKASMRDCDYLERTVVSFQPKDDKIEINIKPLS